MTDVTKLSRLKSCVSAQMHFISNVLLIASVSDPLPTLAGRESGQLRQFRDGFSITWMAIHA